MAGLKSNESIERASAIIRPCSNFSLRLGFLVCILVLASCMSLGYPVLVEKNVQVILPSRHSLPTRYVEYATDLDVDKLWNSENKLTGLNDSLLAYAAINPNEEQETRTISLLLDGTKGAVVNIREKWRSQRGMDRSLGRGRNKGMPTWLHLIHSAKYEFYWPRFRQLLQAWSRKKTHDPLVVAELLGTMKKTMDDFYVFRQGDPQVPMAPSEESARYRTCAVVGNSGILLNPKRLGSVIDSHDVVIRLNNAKVRGFEAYVGTKTTLSFINSNVYQGCSRRHKCFCHPYGNIPIVLYICQVQHLMDIAYCEPHHDAPVIVTDPRFDALCNKLIKWYSVKNYVELTGKSIGTWATNHSESEFHYSSGLQAVVLALGICEKVDMFGFGKDPKAKHHYHTDRKAELSLHDYSAEYLFYNDLAFNRTSFIPFLTEAGIRLPPVTVYV